jgi:hypothetical protein
MCFSFRQQRQHGKASTREKKKYSCDSLADYKKNGCKMLNIEAASANWGRILPVLSHLQTSGILRKILGRKCKMVQAGGSDPAEVTQLQRLRRVSVVYNSRLAWTRHDKVINLNKAVEVRLLTAQKPTPKFMTLVRAYMDLQVPGTNIPAVQAVIPRLSGRHAGSVDITSYADDVAGRAFLQHIATAPAAWWWHYWKDVKGYDLGTRQSLMESFDIDAAALAGNSEFDPVSQLLTWVEFPEDDGYLDEFEKELGLESDDGSDILPGVHVEGGPTESRATLQETLKSRDLEGSVRSDDGASRRTNFSQSTGNSTNRTANTERLAQHHKPRALELAKAKNNEATLTRLNEELMAKVAAMELQQANQESPYLSGGAAAGQESQPVLQNNTGGSAVAQG